MTEPRAPWRSLFSSIREVIAIELLDLCLWVTPQPYRVMLAYTITIYGRLCSAHEKGVDVMRIMKRGGTL
jgi:hypothetical protein